MLESIDHKKNSSFNPTLPLTSHVDLSHLTLDSTLADLPTHCFKVNASTLGHLVARRFEEQLTLPGVIVVNDGKILGAISRRKFLERVGRQYGVEVYLRRPIQVMLQSIKTKMLKLPSQCTIQEAAQIALRRPNHLFYEPVVIQFSSREVRILDAYVLLLAQSQLLSLVSQAEQERRQLAEAMREVGRVLSSSLDSKNVPQQVLHQLHHLVPYERGAVMLYRDGVLETVAHQGFPDDERADTLTISVQNDEDDVFLRIVKTRHPVSIGDVRLDSTWQQIAWLPLNRSWVGVPLIARDRVIGMVSLTRLEANEFTEDDINLVLTFAGQAAIALENARLYAEIVSFKEHLEQMVEQRTEELNIAYKNLERLDRTKSDFITVSAHELRTPLTAISGYAQIIKVSQVIQDDASLPVMLDGIISKVDDLSQIVNSMLDVAKIDNHSLRMYRSEVAMIAVFETIITRLKKAMDERKLTLNLSSLDELPLIHADPSLLTKAFYNIVVNAVKYTPNGGAITISGQAICLAEDIPAIEVIVSDSGTGIDPEHQELIFEKFYQTGELALHSSGHTKFKGGGPGLGLAIVKGIIIAHNGEIWVNSDGYSEEDCPGSHFHVRLPIAASDEE